MSPTRRRETSGVIRDLSRLLGLHGVARHIRSGNRPKRTASSPRRHLESRGVATLHVEPGASGAERAAERFNGRLRDECLSIEAFHSPRQASVVINDYRHHHAERRSNNSPGSLTPEAIAAVCRPCSSDSPGLLERRDAAHSLLSKPLHPTPTRPSPPRSRSRD